MTIDIDARGLACPEPVIRCKQLVDGSQPARLSIQVDNEAAVENLSRFLKLQGYAVASQGEGNDFIVTGSREGDAPVAQPVAAPKRTTTDDGPQKILVFIPTDRMGFGDDELGKKLMISFIKTLKEMGDELWQIVFVNNGVKLTIDGSPVLEELKAYAADGLSILVCGTCLSHFDLLEAKQVGETTNMLDIVTAMQLADKVIQPG